MTRVGCCGAAVAVLLLAGAASAGELSAAAAPTLKNVHATPLAAKGSTASWVLTATATDSDHDLVGGRVQITIGKTVLSRRIAGGKPRGTSAVPTAFGLSSAGLTGKTLRVGFFVKAAPGPFTARLVVRDTHGHASKQVSLFLRVKSAQTVIVSATRAAAAEPSTPGLFTVTRNGSTAAALTVSYTVGGTATAGSDYTTIPATVTIRAGASSATISVAPIDDRTTEPSESVILTLVAKRTYALGSVRSATITIADDDAVAPTTVTIVATDPSAGEVSNPGAFTVTRTGSTAAALTVSYTVGGTATSASDYTALPGSVTIPAGSASATIAVTPLTDSVTEPPETVVVTLVGSTGYTVSSPSSATVTIVDSTPTSTSTVTISATDSSAAEPADPGTFTVSRSGSTTSSLSVSYSVSGSATAGSDYATLPGSVTIPAGASSATIAVTPIDDVTAEGNESVTVTLSSGPGYTVGLSGEATVQIADDDSGQPTVTVTATDAAAAEPDDPGTFTVTRTGSKTAALIVRYTVTGTATGGTDYAALSGIVTIPAAQPSTTITVAPIDNPSFEPSETVIVTLSPDPGYTVGTPDSATVVIADNDTATVTIVATTPNAAEPATPGTFTVTRVGDTSADLIVSYLPSGTAVNGADYAALSGSVTIPAGQSSATITVTPVNDSMVEPPETVILTLTDGPGYVPGTPKSDTVTIADND